MSFLSNSFPLTSRRCRALLSLLALCALPAARGAPSSGSESNVADLFLTRPSDDLSAIGRGSLRSVLKPVQDIRLSSRAAGVIEKFIIEEGAPVRVGDPILSLDSDQEAAEVAQYEALLAGAGAELQRAENEFNRVKPLSEENIFSDKQYWEAKSALEMARSRLKQAEASLSAARTRLKNRTVTSPIDGIFLKKNKSIGEAVDRFETVARVVDVSSIEMIVFCDASLYNRFKLAQEVVVRVMRTDTEQATTTGRVSHIDPIVDPSSGTFRVKIQLKPSPVASPGYSAMLVLP